MKTTAEINRGERGERDGKKGSAKHLLIENAKRAALTVGFSNLEDRIAAQAIGCMQGLAELRKLKLRKVTVEDFLQLIAAEEEAQRIVARRRVAEFTAATR